MPTINLDQLTPGAALEVAPSIVFRVLQRGEKHSFLCCDEQQRLITTDYGTQLLGGPSAQQLADLLTALGFQPSITE